MQLNYRNPVSQHPLNRGLVAWWKVLPHWRGGNVLRDLKRAAHGTLNAMNANDWVSSSRPGSLGALDFDGTNDYVKVDGAGALIPTSHTVSQWVLKYTTAASRIPLNVYAWNSGGQDLYLWYASSTSFRYSVNGGSDLADSGALALNVWTHFVGTYDGATVRLYKNGILAASNSVAVVAGNNEPVMIGCDADATNGGSRGNYWDGQIDDTRIYNRTLAASEVWNLYVLSRQRFSPLLNWQRTRSYAVPLPVAPATLEAYAFNLPVYQSRVLVGGVPLARAVLLPTRPQQSVIIPF